MKIKKIILISLLLAILTIGVVSAAQDVNETIGANNDVILSSDEPVSDFVNISVYEEETIIKGQDDSFYVDITSQRIPDGNLTVSLDGKVAYNQPALRGITDIPYSVISKTLGNNFGVYNITFALSDDSHLKAVSQSWKLNYTYYKYNLPSELSSPYLDMSFTNDVAGTVTLTIDNKKVGTQTIEDGYVWINFENLKYGKHSYKLEFKSKNTKVFKSFTHTGTFNYGYLFEISTITDEIYYGEWAYLEINMPWDIKNNVTISYNGKSKTAKADEEGIVYFDIDDLKLGENKVTVSYPKDSKYPAKSKTVTINVKEILNVTGDVGYMSGEGVFLKLPENANGNLSVIVDGVEKLYSLDNGIAKVDLSGYEMGSHTIKVNYTGDDYSIAGFEGTFNVVANFIYLKNVYYKDGVNVSISLPNDANGTLVVSYDKRYKKVDVVNGCANVFFDNISPCEGMEFTMQYLNGNYADYKKESYINAREDPADYELIIDIPETVLTNGNDYARCYFGSYSEGYINVTIDGKYYGNATVEENSAWFNLNKVIKDLKSGNHTITIDYSGDEYYAPKSNTTSFNLGFYRIYPIDGLFIGDSLYMLVNADVSGAATLYIAGKTIKGEYDDMYDDYDDNKYIRFELSKIPCGEYNAKLVFAGDKKYAKFTKEFKLNVTYLITLDVDDENYLGENTTLHFATAADISEVNITVGNQTFTRTTYDNEVFLEVKNIVLGEQKVSLTCFATGKYPQKTFNWTYYVSSKINVPERIDIIDGGNITLKLPDDAKGNLELFIYDEGDLIDNYTAKMKNGSAVVKFKLSKLGYYGIIAKYVGDDYNVSGIDTKLAVSPKITYPHKIYLDQDANLTFEMPSDANGELTLAFAAVRLNANYKDGKATVAIPHFEAIEDDVYYLYVLYEDPVYGTFYDDSFDYLDVMKYEAKITPILPKEIIANNYITVTLKFPVDATGYVMGDDDYVEINNGKATLKFFVSKAGKNSLYYYYSGNDKYKEDSYWFDVNALPAPKLTMSDVSVYYRSTATFKVKVVDSYGKIVTGKYVAFYVNGVKVKSVKTDKNGFATIKLTKNPGTYNVKATYKGGVVTKKLTVNHLVTLKTVKVKKSAKKLVLKVTLKKGKKALKYKKITFKFNGKKYVKYTNKKGIAKLTIKKKVLKKLKIGKKVTYQATYLKDTVKKTAIVIK